jgi:hypothetical protein
MNIGIQKYALKVLWYDADRSPQDQLWTSYEFAATFQQLYSEDSWRSAIIEGNLWSIYGQTHKMGKLNTNSEGRGKLKVMA